MDDAWKRRIDERLAAHDATRHEARWRYRLRLEAAGLRDGSGQWHSASREEIGPT
jgi:hypothetical protein